VQMLGAVPSWPLTAAIINTSPVIIGLTIRDVKGNGGVYERKVRKG
jgi:hypothetical protein